MSVCVQTIQVRMYVRNIYHSLLLVVMKLIKNEVCLFGVGLQSELS